MAVTGFSGPMPGPCHAGRAGLVSVTYAVISFRLWACMAALDVHGCDRVLGADAWALLRWARWLGVRHLRSHISVSVQMLA